MMLINGEINDAGNDVIIKDKEQAADDGRLDHNDFNYDLNSTDDSNERNLSSRSDVLGPNNSTESDNDKRLTLDKIFEKAKEEGIPIIDERKNVIKRDKDEQRKKNLLKFDLRCKA